MSMKILRRGDDFRKMPESNMIEVKVINNLIKQGWNYCSKSEYKKFNGIETIKEPVVVDSDVKTKKVTREKRMERKKRGK